jgi:hypothetical protein
VRRCFPSHLSLVFLRRFFFVYAFRNQFYFFGSLVSRATRANETAFKQEVEKIYTSGPTWTRVNSLVDLQQKTDRKDVGRMKVLLCLLAACLCTCASYEPALLKPCLQSVLTQVKEAPPAHMSK